jgi:C4-dicarboxylate-specific signal transduction histidine kinase
VRSLLKVSLAKKILGIELLVLVVTLGPATFWEVSARRRDIRSENDLRVTRTISNLALGLRVPLWNYSDDETKKLMTSAIQHPLLARVTLFDGEGHIIIDEKTKSYLKISLGAPTTVPIVFNKKQIGQLVVESDNTELEQTLFQETWDLIVRNVLITLAITTLTFFFIRRVVIRRIMELDAQARLLRLKFFDEEFQWSADDEIGSVGVSLNEARIHLKDAFLNVAATNKKLLELNRQLEDRVAQKTAQVVHSSRLASLGEMSAGIAHEINNPLTVIQGLTRMLHKYAGQPTEFAARVERIEKAVQRISKIVNGLRKFSRTSSKREHKIHSFEELFNEVIVLTEARSRRSDTPVLLEATSNPEIFCDDIEIEQVLVNLIHNGIDAVKNMPERWVKLQVYETESSVIVHVRDSGPGIPAEVAEKLFQPFFTTKGVGEGTGLGLPIVKGILDDHGAAIRLRPHESSTCFEIVFPKAESQRIPA